MTPANIVSCIELLTKNMEHLGVTKLLVPPLIKKISNFRWIYTELAIGFGQDFKDFLSSDIVKTQEKAENCTIVKYDYFVEVIYGIL